MSKKIFINYRKALNKSEARLIQAHLQRHFGRSRVFLDENDLEAGKHWLQELERRVDKSSAMIVLIGKGWVDLGYEPNDPLAQIYKRRLDNPEDFVRFEIARAFTRSIPVLPVLLDDGKMPSIEELPANLKPLTFQHATVLRGEILERDCEEVARTLKVLIAESRRRGLNEWQATALMVSAVAVGILLGPLLFQSASIDPPLVSQPKYAQIRELSDALVRAEAERDEALLQAEEAQAEAARARHDNLALKQEVDDAEAHASALAQQLRAARTEPEVTGLDEGCSAEGLAVGYYVNMVRDVIFQSGGALAQGGLEHFYVIRLDDILNREDNEKRLRDILARATGEAHENAADYNRKYERPTSGNRPIWAAVAGNAIIDLPTPLYSLFHAPPYQRLQSRMGHTNPKARQMRQRMISAFFEALQRQMFVDDTVSRNKLQVVTFDELEALLGLR